MSQETETIKPKDNQAPAPAQEQPGAAAPDMSALDNLDLDFPVAAQEQPGQEQPGAAQAIPTAEFLKPAFYGMFAALAPNWEVQMSECEMLAEVWTPVLDKYFPNLPESPLVVAMGATAIVFMPRMGKPRRKKAAPPGQVSDTEKPAAKPVAKPTAAPQSSRHE